MDINILNEREYCIGFIMYGDVTKSYRIIHIQNNGDVICQEIGFGIVGYRTIKVDFDFICLYYPHIKDFMKINKRRLKIGKI